jgi:DNA (cytosine-5)-methyltransferase 1
MLDLCAGIGGASLAASWAGIEIAGQVEIDPFCQAVLAKHWPSVKRMGDIKEVQGHEFGEIDIVFASLPCQPHSLAGKRQGSGDERNLWPEARRIIGKIKPRWVMAENVCGLLTVESGRFFGSILSDLDTLGYRVGWGVYGASEVGAPHRRERIFIVAHSDRNGQRFWQSQSEFISECQRTSDADGKEGAMAHSRSSRRQECNMPTITEEQRHIARLNVADSTECRFNEQQDTRQPESGICGSTYGISNRMDQSVRFPAGPGEPQHSWEPPRTITEKILDRSKRLKALGNAIVPQQIYPIFDLIAKSERGIDNYEPDLLFETTHFIASQGLAGLSCGIRESGVEDD